VGGFAAKKSKGRGGPTRGSHIEGEGGRWRPARHMAGGGGWHDVAARGGEETAEGRTWAGLGRRDNDRAHEE
jgi:hypothetical protein